MSRPTRLQLVQPLKGSRKSAKLREISEGGNGRKGGQNREETTREEDGSWDPDDDAA